MRKQRTENKECDSLFLRGARERRLKCLVLIACHAIWLPLKAAENFGFLGEKDEKEKIFTGNVCDDAGSWNDGCWV